MKKLIAAVVLIMTVLTGTFGVRAYDVPEAYMGFSVSEGWYAFSKNMTDTALLEAVDLTADEVNEALVNSDCEYFITNPEENAEIYVKVKKNELSQELYNIIEAEDQMIMDHLDRILKDGFSVDQFEYDPAGVTVTAYPQMKFITVPGTVLYDGAKHGMIFGATFVNGNGIAFMMYLDQETVGEQHLSAFSEIASSVSFTQIKEKGEAQAEDSAQTEIGQSALQYIAGGFGGVALVALILYLIGRIKKSEKAGENEEDNKLD